MYLHGWGRIGILREGHGLLYEIRNQFGLTLLMSLLIAHAIYIYFIK